MREITITPLSQINLPREKCTINPQSFCPQSLHLPEGETECPLHNCVARTGGNVVIIL